MSFQQYRWDIEERVEDAIVALLKANVGRDCMIIQARSVVVAQFPLVVVDASTSDNVSDTATFNGQRRVSVTVAISTEAINQSPELTQAELLEDAREQHRAVKSSVIGVLASTVLHDELNALQLEGIAISMAHMTAQTRSVEDNKLITEQTLDVIACPKEI